MEKNTLPNDWDTIEQLLDDAFSCLQTQKDRKVDYDAAYAAGELRKKFIKTLCNQKAGYVSVPVIPTKEQINLAWKALRLPKRKCENLFFEPGFVTAYLAMIKAYLK